VPGRQRGDEALDVFFHVRPGELAQVGDERLRAAVERLVEAMDRLLLEDVREMPFAVGAAQADLPAGAVGLFPRDGVDQLGRALGAHVDVRVDGDEVLERDDLDGLAGGQDHLADELLVIRGRTLFELLHDPLIGMPRRNLNVRPPMSGNRPRHHPRGTLSAPNP
jgi:hypothetical protein